MNVGEMKKYISFKVLGVFLMSLIIAQAPAIAEESGKASAGESENQGDRALNESTGYYFGYTFGNMLKQGGNEDIDIDSLHQGIVDSLAGRQPDLSVEEQRAVVELIRARQQEVSKEREEAQQRAEARQEELGAENLARAETFLEKNAEKAEVQTTDSGLQYEIVEKGSGPRPDEDSRVVVHYEGRLTNGEVFDSSRARGSPAEFGLQQVIPGWTEGLQLINEGGKARLYIPPALGYGAGGTETIPPNAVLVFDVELLEVK